MQTHFSPSRLKSELSEFSSIYTTGTDQTQTSVVVDKEEEFGEHWQSPDPKEGFYTDFRCYFFHLITGHFEC